MFCCQEVRIRNTFIDLDAASDCPDSWETSSAPAQLVMDRNEHDIAIMEDVDVAETNVFKVIRMCDKALTCNS